MLGEATAVVSRIRDCTMCRECIRREGWNKYDRVLLGSHTFYRVTLNVQYFIYILLTREEGGSLCHVD